MTQGSSVRPPSWVDALTIARGNAPTSGSLPKAPGQCISTQVARVAPRLNGGDYESGTSVTFTNGGYQVSYDREPALIGSNPGDRVVMCLTAIPQNCPVGDDRGRSYMVTNLRTRQTWSLGDSQHICGGA